MCRCCSLRHPWSVVGFGLAALGAASITAANPTVRSAFVARYPTTTLLTRAQTTTGSQCNACHQPPNTSTPGNCYRDAIKQRMLAGRSAAQALADIEGLDSDGDGYTNLDEITRVRTDLPGQVGFNPGLVGATGTDPCATNPTTPVTNQRETPLPPPPVACNRADITEVGGTADNPGSPDNQLTVDDVIVFINLFSDGTGCPVATAPAGPACSRADIADLGDTGAGPDGQLTVDDLIAFFNAFSDGC